MAENTEQAAQAPPHPTDQPPMHPMARVLIEMDEIRILFNNIGQGDDKLTDLVVARLLNSDLFYQRLADAMMSRAVAIKNASEQRRQADADGARQEQEPGKASQSGSAPAGYTVQELSTATAGYYPFDGHEGFIDVIEGEYTQILREEDGTERSVQTFGVVGGEMYFNASPAGAPDSWAVRSLGAGAGFAYEAQEGPTSNEYLTVIMDAVRGSYEFVSATIAANEKVEGIEATLQTSRFWFRMNRFVSAKADDDTNQDTQGHD